MTTKDIEIALQKPGSSESLGYIADALRDLFRRLNLTPSDSVGIAFDLILFFVGLLCSLSYGIARVPGLLVRVAYWRKIRRERERN